MSEEEKLEAKKRYISIFQELDDQKKLIAADVKDTRQSFIDDGSLTKEEIKVLERSYRLVKKGVDLDEIIRTADEIRDRVRVD